jgi:DNA (cytosine-5)-methyltransferase 1
VVDLFSGCGGMSLGFERAGFDIVAAFDSWNPAVNCYSLNFAHPIMKTDLSKVAAVVPKLKTLRPEVIIGGPPCQDFSSAGKRMEAGRADLTNCFAQIVTKIKPAAFVMENVERARLSNAYADAKSVLVKANYRLTELLLDASFYGVPQIRKRLFCIGILNGADDSGLVKNISAMASDHPMTVREYLGNEFGVQYYYRHPRNYSRRAVYSIDEPSATIRGVNRPVPPGYPGHPNDACAVTPSLRPLTMAERARIQTFPSSFKLVGNKSEIEQPIGNAVPVELARVVGLGLLKELCQR